MEIDLTGEQTFGEPGPNCVWLVSGRELRAIIDSIQELCAGVIQEIKLVDAPGVKLTGCSAVILKCDSSKKDLIKLADDGSVVSSLPADVWASVLELMRSITQDHGFQYIELDEMPELVAEANWIIERRPEFGERG